MIVDLDSIVRLHDDLDAIGRRRYYVNFLDGTQLWVTKPAFDRILVAWKSNEPCNQPRSSEGRA